MLTSVTACSTIGDPGSTPEAYPHGGTGQFRQLERDEVGIADGRLLALQDVAVGAAMVAGEHLFYASAPLLETPPEVPMDHPAGEVYWDAFEARAIHRSAPRDDRGYRSGPTVLSASESWEGADVFDPWVVIDEGRARMYYAAEGGIGVAEAPSVGGAFSRVGSGPILEADGSSAAPRRPSVVRGVDGAWWMYFDDAGAIGVARSEDGLAFERVDGDPSTEALDPIVITGADLGEDGTEVSVGMPGAAALDTATGRRLVRVYYESRRDDGSVLAYVAGSEDGLAFERHEVPVMDEADARFPAPLLLDDRVTLLYANLRGGSDYQTRALYVAVSPASVSFAAPENE